MLRTRQLPWSPLPRTGSLPSRGPCCQGPRRLPGPEFHRLDDASLSLGCPSITTYFLTGGFPSSLDTHWEARSGCHSHSEDVAVSGEPLLDAPALWIPQPDPDFRTC